MTKTQVIPQKFVFDEERMTLRNNKPENEI